MVGRVDRIDVKRVQRHWKADGVDLGRLLHRVDPGPGKPVRHTQTQEHGLAAALDNHLIARCRAAIDGGTAVQLDLAVRNVHRSVGAMLSGEIARKHGHGGLPADTIRIDFTGVAGQSFGAWLAHGVTLSLTGDANDYVGKGLSGGCIIVKQPDVGRIPSDNIIVGNTVLYGAIAGEAYFNGVAGERFAVRNSGAVAVVEGTGDHACEYMTGGVVCVLGTTGRNFAAGMSGGIAYVYDPDGNFERLCNRAQVDIEPVVPSDETDDGPDRPLQRAVSVNDSGMGNPLRHDAERLRILVERHRLHTGSARAAELLADWDTSLTQFRKVVPRDYRRALQALDAERRDAEMEAAE